MHVHWKSVPKYILAHPIHRVMPVSFCAVLRQHLLIGVVVGVVVGVGVGVGVRLCTRSSLEF